jgi:hypothetical protein
MSETIEKNDMSKNEFAADVMGYRNKDGSVIIIDEPCEVGFHCPVCKYETATNGNYDERLRWSEYIGFLWCGVCNKDYPSCFCIPDMDTSITTFLLQIGDAKSDARRTALEEAAEWVRVHNSVSGASESKKEWVDDISDLPVDGYNRRLQAALADAMLKALGEQ